MRGKITLVTSKNPAVFMTPTEIEFDEFPRLDESFRFKGYEGACWTSAVRNVYTCGESFLFHTRNSVYKLEIL